MTSTTLAASNVMLSAAPSLMLAIIVLLLVGLVVAREAVRLQDSSSPTALRLTRVVRVLTPAALGLLAVRLLVILQ